MFVCDISVFNKYGKQLLDEMLRPLGVDWRALVVMLVIDQVPGIAQTRLSPFLQTDKANISKLLQVMEGKGLIRRQADGEDQRNKVIHLTDQGERRLPQLQAVLDRWEAACFLGIDPEEIRQFQRISERITQNLVK